MEVDKLVSSQHDQVKRADKLEAECQRVLG